MARPSPLFILPPVIFAGLAAIFILGLGRDDPRKLPSMLEGNPAPKITLTQLGDLPLLSDDIIRKGPVKLVNFWASWCVSCRAEHPTLLKMSKMGIPIYGIDYKDKPEDGLKYLADNGNPFLAVGGDSGRLAIDFGVYGVPETFVIDTAGKVILRFPGPISERSLKSTILPAIAKAQAQ